MQRRSRLGNDVAQFSVTLDAFLSLVFLGLILVMCTPFSIMPIRFSALGETNGCVACCHTESESLYLLNLDGFNGTSIRPNTLKNTAARSDAHLFNEHPFYFYKISEFKVKFGNIRLASVS